jgi:hypothetical protein
LNDDCRLQKAMGTLVSVLADWGCVEFRPTPDGIMGVALKIEVLARREYPCNQLAQYHRRGADSRELFCRQAPAEAANQSIVL